ncbi:MAG: response regulator transcription factor, partial [Acidimicrobiia bacterium]|nr:response regulator transcription factor [Acidimicrobiia bacterium]NNL28941.1 response regulator transcription factor [Acidimicrobiia bacterium]
KPFAYEELIARVAALLRRTRPQDEGLLRFEALTMDVPAMEVRWESEPIDVTTLEFRLLEYFLINPRIVLSRSRILEAVWDLNAETSSNVVDVYVRYLRQKLDAAGAPPLIQTVRGAGYVLRKQ